MYACTYCPQESQNKTHKRTRDPKTLRFKHQQSRKQYKINYAKKKTSKKLGDMKPYRLQKQ